ncbi:hypothetical protein [Bacteroides graminisolvens]|uniref:PEGA domain-containing protein n=1 Tax=Bacteroides graminisolvens DSM 19988 = JCM 15093 TaxID=1121097 RepID=A0A069D774_9BACE|nr:hypothetical protein [Bacteroides graminisolvens]GAK38210.1 hypothetical protein JCM15093_3531 [Bacteroides graminisolvens DSM 19988 = JCM 15093]
MKKILLFVLPAMLLSSCCTLFTPSKQAITFNGENGIKIYDDGVKIAEIKDNNTTSVRIKKELSSKYLIAKKEGYRPTPLKLDTKFDAVAVINILFWPGFVVDAATGQMCKWDSTNIDIEMEK